jgi:hypothetical protein
LISKTLIFENFWGPPLIQFSKFNNFLWVCWFLILYPPFENSTTRIAIVNTYTFKSNCKKYKNFMNSKLPHWPNWPKPAQISGYVWWKEPIPDKYSKSYDWKNYKVSCTTFCDYFCHNTIFGSSRVSFHFLNSIFQGRRFSIQFLNSFFQSSTISLRFLNFCQGCY